MESSEAPVVRQINYLRPGAIPPPRHGRMILLYVLAMAVFFIAARVEYLNAMARFPLPRNMPNDVGKWQVSSLNEARWRESYGPHDPSGQPVQRDLTSAEKNEMRSAIRRTRATADLRDWVGSAGLLQYLLLLVLGIAMINAVVSQPTRRRAMQLLPAALVFLFALGSIWYRSYFSSLGW